MHQPAKILVVTSIVGEPLPDAYQRLRTEHRTGSLTVHLSQGSPSRIEWTETVRDPTLASPSRLVRRTQETALIA